MSQVIAQEVVRNAWLRAEAYLAQNSKTHAEQNGQLKEWGYAEMLCKKMRTLVLSDPYYYTKVLGVRIGWCSKEHRERDPLGFNVSG